MQLQPPAMIMDAMGSDSLPTISLEHADPLSDNTFGNHSPSPSHSSPIDLPGYDMGDASNYQQASNVFRNSSPFDGSFNGDFGSQSEQNWGEREQGGLLDTYEEDDYNPSEYDAQDSASNMNASDLSPYIFDDLDFPPTAPQLSVTPAEAQMNDQTLITVDGGSPVSSLDGRSPSPMRSRASSNASSHGGTHHLNQSFTDQLTFGSQYSYVQNAPSPPSPSQSPHSNGPRSPPSILIPDSIPNNSGMDAVNAGLYPPGQNGLVPNGGGHLGAPGPGINLIPATPVSGRGIVGNSAPFANPYNSQGETSLSGLSAPYVIARSDGL